MKAATTIIFMLAALLALGGCGTLSQTMPTGYPPSENAILLSPGSATLAEELENAKPLVNLNRQR